MTLANQTDAWKELAQYYADHKDVTLQKLFDADPARKESWKHSCGDLQLDLSHTHMTQDLLARLIDLAKAQDLEKWRDAMFVGKAINNTEKRAVLHTALRTKSDTPIMVDGEDVMPAIRAAQDKMKQFTSAVREGQWRGATGKRIEHVVNIGVGGSDLGPRLAVSALRDLANGPAVHFVANIDAAERHEVLKSCDPETTLFVMVSKSFSTEETFSNAGGAREWLVEAMGADSVSKHFVAVSSNIDAAEQFGVEPDHVFPMWGWVGGRYSLWSAVGLSIALSIGYDGFEKLLAGAAKADEHFKDAPLDQNMPVLMALTGIYYRNFVGTSAQAVLPYSERLRDFPRFLQQLDMESNGKSVTREGEAISYQTSAVIFGECGTVGQHSFHQFLHQGTQMVPADFIDVRDDDMEDAQAHDALHMHRRAQIEALAFGAADADPARQNLGNKPSLNISLSRLDPENMGILLALYEHKVFAQGVIWGLNPFDQFGVQLGKKLVSDARKK